MRTIPVRWRILTLLSFVALVNYFLRNPQSNVQPFLREEFHFTSTELGWILGAFNITYTFLQVPGGIFGQKLGPRLALGSIAVTWGVLTWLTGFLPGLMAASATGVLVSLVVVRLLLGASNAPIFPVQAATVEAWFPPGRWALPNALTSAGLSLGQAMIGPIVTALILAFGWRSMYYLLAPLGVVVGVWWLWYARDRPAQHRAMTPGELAFIDAGRSAASPPPVAPGSIRAALANRDVLVLAVSYFCLNTVFYTFSYWLFTYLVESRKFSMLEGGWLSALPFVTGAVVTAVGGGICDALCRRYGGRLGCRITAVSGLVLVSFFLSAGVYATDPYVAVALLSLCFGFTMFADTCYWVAATYASGEHTASASGLMNFGGNVPGLLAPVFGFAIDHFGWVPTIASGSVFALMGAALWFFVRLKDAPGAFR